MGRLVLTLLAIVMLSALGCASKLEPAGAPANAFPTYNAPAEGRGVVHVLQSGENLYRLSRHYGVSVDAISRNLEVTTRNLNEFSSQIRENPGVLLRGRESAAGAPE